MNKHTLEKLRPIVNASIGILLSVAALNCVKIPTEPVLPESDIQGSIPVINRTWTVEDMILKDTSKVKEDATGGFYYTDSKSFNPTRIDTIRVTPKASGNQVALGLLTVPGLATQTTTTTAGDMGMGTISYPGANPPLVPAWPETSFVAQGIQLQDTADFDYLHVVNGNMILSVTNHLAIGVTFQPIYLRNDQTTFPIDTTRIARFDVGRVGPGQTVSVAYPLDGELVRGFLKTDSLRVRTDSTSNPFTINSTDGISFGFGTTSIDVDSASAKIPQQSLLSVNDSTITVDSTAYLQQALFTRGNFSLNVNNQSGLYVGVRLSFANFVRAIAPYDTLFFDTLVAPHTNFSFPVNLTNYKVINGAQNISGGTAVRFSLGIRTVNSQGLKLPVASSNYVLSSFQPLNQFVVKSLTGIMNPMTVAVNNGVPLTGLGDASKGFTGQFSFDSVEFVLKVGLNGGFPVQHNLTLYAVNRKVSPPRFDSLKVPSNIIYPGLSNVGVITLNNATGLPAFLSHAVLADTFYLRGSLVINPNRGSGNITDTTKVYPSMSMYIPIKLGLKDGQYVDVTPISGKFDSGFVANVQSGSLYFTIANRMPVSVAFRMAFLKTDSATRRQDTVLTIPQTGLGDVYAINGAQVDVNGFAVDPAAQTQFKFTLTNPEIMALVGADSLYTRFSINTSGAALPTVQAVHLQAQDYINVKASANMVYKLKERSK